MGGVAAFFSKVEPARNTFRTERDLGAVGLFGYFCGCGALWDAGEAELVSRSCWSTGL